MPFALRDQGTLKAQQKGGDEGDALGYPANSFHALAVKFRVVHKP